MNNQQELQKSQIENGSASPKLDERLKTCCEFLRGRVLADIGTDHAYLPAAFAAAKKIPRAIASDVAEGPLKAAQKTLREFGVEKLVELRQCDGLSGFSPGEAEDFVIAGMGGELIARILEAAPWLKAPGYRLVLQPMTQQPHLRRYLYENGFALLNEKAVLCGGKVYTVLCAEWREDLPQVEPVFFEIGLISPKTPAGAKYFEKVRRRLQNRLRGAEHRENEALAKELRALLYEIKQKETGETP